MYEPNFQNWSKKIEKRKYDLRRNLSTKLFVQKNLETAQLCYLHDNDDVKASDTNVRTCQMKHLIEALIFDFMMIINTVK